MYMYIWAEVVYLKSKVKKTFNMPIPCVSPKSISLQSFIYGFTLVSEIREFNQKKKEKNSEKGFFEFDTFPIVKKNPFF